MARRALSRRRGATPQAATSGSLLPRLERAARPSRRRGERRNSGSAFRAPLRRAGFRQPSGIDLDARRDIPRNPRDSSTSLALLRGALRFRAFALFGAELRDALDQLDRHRLGEREADRALAHLVGGKVILECGDQPRASWGERVVLLPPGVIEHRASILQPESGDLIANHLLRLRNRLADGAAHLLENRLHCPGLRPDVL